MALPVDFETMSETSRHPSSKEDLNLSSDFAGNLRALDRGLGSSWDSAGSTPVRPAFLRKLQVLEGLNVASTSHSHHHPLLSVSRSAPTMPRISVSSTYWGLIGDVALSHMNCPGSAAPAASPMVCRFRMVFDSGGCKTVFVW